MNDNELIGKSIKIISCLANHNLDGSYGIIYSVDNNMIYGSWSSIPLDYKEDIFEIF